MNRLDEVRALLLARRLADEALGDAVRAWIQAGEDRSLLASELGIERSTLYRRYVWESTETREAVKGGRRSAKRTLDGLGHLEADNGTGQPEGLAL